MSVPEKLIQTDNDLNKFHETETFHKYFEFIKLLQESVKSRAISETKKIVELSIYNEYLSDVRNILL